MIYFIVLVLFLIWLLMGYQTYVFFTERALSFCDEVDFWKKKEKEARTMTDKTIAFNHHAGLLSTEESELFYQKGKLLQADPKAFRKEALLKFLVLGPLTKILSSE